MAQQLLSKDGLEASQFRAAFCALLSVVLQRAEVLPIAPTAPTVDGGAGYTLFRTYKGLRRPKTWPTGVCGNKQETHI